MDEASCLDGYWVEEVYVAFNRAMMVATVRCKDLTGDKLILSAARSFRDEIVGCFGGEGSAGYCFMVCAPLKGYLSFTGIKGARIVYGDVDLGGETGEHCWISLPDGRVLDPTVDQYGLDLPEVYLGAPHPIVHAHRSLA